MSHDKTAVLNEITLNKVDAAVDQLDWAMRLVVDHQAFVPAITLAAAAEEILGKRAGAPVLREVAQALGAEHGIEERQIVAQHMNRMRDWLKHDGSGHSDEIRCDVQLEAIAMIHRAIINLARFDRSAPSQWPRFWEWVEVNAAQYVAAGQEL